MKKRISMLCIAIASLLCGCCYNAFSTNANDYKKVTTAGETLTRNIVQKFKWKHKNTRNNVLLIPETYTTIGDRAFLKEKQIKSVKMLGDVTSIGEQAFEKCTKLESIDLPETLKTIGNNAFKNCESLMKITVPNGVISIGEEAFSGCHIPQSIEIPSSVQLIGKKAFYECNNLENINLNRTGNNATTMVAKLSIEEGAFANCPLKSILIPDRVESIGIGAFSHCWKVRHVKIDRGIDTIKENVFGHCNKLKTIDIGDSVKSIKEGAFSNCKNLETICLPNTIESIDQHTFDGCHNIKTIIVYHRPEEQDDNTARANDENAEKLLKKLKIPGKIEFKKRTNGTKLENSDIDSIDNNIELMDQPKKQ